MRCGIIIRPRVERAIDFERSTITLRSRRFGSSAVGSSKSFRKWPLSRCVPPATFHLISYLLRCCDGVDVEHFDLLPIQPQFELRWLIASLLSSSNDAQRYSPSRRKSKSANTLPVE